MLWRALDSVRGCAASAGASRSRGFECHVEVSWSVENIKNEATFQFNWREIDGPAVVKPERRGFGSRLIEEILARDFDGASAIEYLSLGVHCRITSPLRSLRSD